MNPLRRLWSALSSLADVFWAWDSSLREANDAFREQLHLTPVVAYRPPGQVETPPLLESPANGAADPETTKNTRRKKSA